MATLTIGKLDDETKRLLQQRAVSHNRSVEEKARQILRSALRKDLRPADSIGDRLFQISRPGVELPDARDRTPYEPWEPAHARRHR